MLVDAACGVGGLILPGVLERMGDVMCCHTQNKPSKPTTLNVGCGAEFVHKSHKAPMNYDTKSKVQEKVYVPKNIKIVSKFRQN